MGRNRARPEEIAGGCGTHEAEVDPAPRAWKLLFGLARGTFGKSDTSTLDKGLRICYSKYRETSATDPFGLAACGNFNGVREVLTTSDRALSDVSSALKEVTAVTSGGDGQVLEEVLETGLKMRKQVNEIIYSKLARAEFGGKTAGGAEGPEGMLQFFKEASLWMPSDQQGPTSSARGGSSQR